MLDIEFEVDVDVEAIGCFGFIGDILCFLRVGGGGR